MQNAAQTNMIKTEEIGKEIKRRRNFLKLSQNDLAEHSGISVRSLKDIESGKGNPGILQLLKLLDVLGMEINIFVGDK